MKPAADRVRHHTAEHVNEKISRETERNVVRAVGQNKTAMTRRITALDQEWDIERYLEMNAAALAFTGVLLGVFVNRKFLAIPAVVLPFLFQHAVQGWCPPVPLLRRWGIRTRKEIDIEKFALKGLRGDFDSLRISTNGGIDRAREAWQAANT